MNGGGLENSPATATIDRDHGTTLAGQVARSLMAGEVLVLIPGGRLRNIASGSARLWNSPE